jgi:hypothetical protein
MFGVAILTLLESTVFAYILILTVPNTGQVLGPTHPI